MAFPARFPYVGGVEVYHSFPSLAWPICYDSEALPKAVGNGIDCGEREAHTSKSDAQGQSTGSSIDLALLECWVKTPNTAL